MAKVMMNCDYRYRIEYVLLISSMLEQNRAVCHAIRSISKCTWCMLLISPIHVHGFAVHSL